MKQVRSGDLKRKRVDSSCSNTHEPIKSADSQSTPRMGPVESDLDFNIITHVNSLISLAQQFLCPDCKCLWQGFVSVKERSGLYIQLEFTCDNCAYVTRLRSSPEIPGGRRHEINVRLAIGSTLSGLGRVGVMKLLGSLNLPPPVQEEKFRETQEFILNYVEKTQKLSMVAAVESFCFVFRNKTS